MEIIPEDLLTGLRNYWYPVLSTEQLGDEPVGVTRLGERIVVWRDGDGVARAFEDRCAHRRAPLSAGDMVGGRLQCRYHGLQYDGTGQCRLVPVDLEEDGRQARQMRVRSYPTEELAGLVWAYIGDEELFPPEPLGTDPAMTDPKFVSVVTETFWEANWLLVHENTSDPAHVPFLHGHLGAYVVDGEFTFRPAGPGNPVITPEMSIDTVRDKLHAIETEDGVIVERVDASEDHTETFDGVEFRLPCEAKVWVPAPDGGRPIRSVQFELPIDRDQTVVYAWLGREVQEGEDRDEVLGLLRNFVVPAFHEVFHEDSWITRLQGDVVAARDGERLLSSDVGPIAVRRIVEKAYWKHKERLAEVTREHHAEREMSQ